MSCKSPALQTRALPQVAGGAARFSFQQLCRAVLGPADYQALAGRFHTVFITGIPALSLAVRRIAYMHRLYILRCLLHLRTSSGQATHTA
jgi:predicted ATPase